MNQSKRIVTAITSSALIGLVSCSLVLDTEISQCEVDGDCAAKGADFAGYVCSPDKVCVRTAAYCENNQQCIQANGGKPFLCDLTVHRCSEGCAASADGTKTGTQQCVEANGAGYICENSKCTEGCEASPDNSRSASQSCVDAKGPGFICKSARCIEGCENSADGSKTGTQSCIETKGVGYVCKDAKCVIGCETDEQCPGTGQICKDGGCVTGCRTNAACIDQNGGQPFACRQDTNVCVGLITTECPQVLSEPLPNLRNDDILYVGLMSNLGGQNSIVAMHEGADLARREFMTAGGNGLTLGKKKRPIVYVSCDNNDNKAEKGLHHLVDDIGVQAMVGPSNSGIFSTFGASIVQQAGRFAISGTASGVQVDPILKASNGLLYRTAPGDILQAEAVPKYITEVLEPQIKAKLPVGSTIRVAVAYRNDALGNGYGQYLNSNIKFNGKSAADNGSDYVSVNYGDPVKDDAATFAQKQAAVASQLLAFKPHIVYLGGGPEAVKEVKPIEDGWTDATFRPTYIYPQPVFASPALGTYINGVTAGAAAGQRDDQRRRQIGLIQTSSNAKSIVDDYKFRHLAQFPIGTEWPALTPIPPATTPPKSTGPNATAYGYYDAAYTLFFSMIATGKENPTGRDIADAVVKTQPATGAVTTLIGPTTLVGISTDLAAGKTVDLTGILSDLNFVDNATRTPFAFWCLPSGATQPIETSLRYDPATKAFSGTQPTAGVFPECP